MITPYPNMFEHCFSSTIHMTIVDSDAILKAEKKAMTEINKILKELETDKSKRRVLKHLFDIYSK